MDTKIELLSYQSKLYELELIKKTIIALDYSTNPPNISIGSQVEFLPIMISMAIWNLSPIQVFKKFEKLGIISELRSCYSDSPPYYAKVNKSKLFQYYDDLQNALDNNNAQKKSNFCRIKENTFYLDSLDGDPHAMVFERKKQNKPSKEEILFKILFNRWDNSKTQITATNQFESLITKKALCAILQNLHHEEINLNNTIGNIQKKIRAAELSSYLSVWFENSLKGYKFKIVKPV